jgi:quercetin dioxygenase-like cupin family protein
MSDYPQAPGDTLLFENDRVRVWSMTLEAGQMFDFHQHHHDHVVLWPDEGTAQAQELGDPEWGLVQQASPGFVLYRTVGHRAPLTPHRIRNTGEQTVTHYVIELLERSPSAETSPWVFNDRGSIRSEERS